MKKFTKEQFIYFLLGVVSVFLYNSLSDIIIKIMLIINRT